MNPSDFHNGLCSHCRYEIFDTLTAHVGGQSGQRVRFVQVGANDGQSGSDPIFPYVRAHRWSGTLVEPVPYLFDRLQKSYAGFTDLQFVQACCGPEEGEQPFYLVDEASEATSLIGPFLSSFDKNVILNHRGLIPNIEEYVREVRIDTLRVDTVIQRTGLADLHILAVDTEGADDLVVQSMDLNKFHPHIVFLEHKHIRFDALRELLASYKRAGYEQIWMYEDLMLVGPEIWQYEHVRKIAGMLESMYRV